MKGVKGVTRVQVYTGTLSIPTTGADEALTLAVVEEGQET